MNRRSRAPALRQTTLPILLCLLVGLACATSPLGRSRVLLYTDAEMTRLGQQAYAQLAAATPQSTDSSTNTYVSCVTDAILGALDSKQRAFAPGGHWEVRVFEDDSANAFALPGGKIGVHTGLLEVARNQDQLATVVGHEIAHVLARHSAERASTQQLAGFALGTASIALGNQSPEAQQGWMAVFGIAAQGTVLKFSRTHEAEADVYGLELMARAGFDPRESARLWQNMAAAAGGQQPPEFMSTHPSHATRISGLQRKAPEFQPLYDQVVAAGRAPRCR